MATLPLPLVQVPLERQGEDGFAPEDYLVSDDGRHPETLVVEADWQRRVHAALRAALARLSARERAIVEARTLSDSGKATKLRELAARLGLSVARVCQIEKQAVAKIKRQVLAACPPDTAAA